jgi:alkylated DNA repair dioxygenase AlkB
MYLDENDLSGSSQHDLFGKAPLVMLPGQLDYLPGFFDPTESAAFFDALVNGIQWRQETLKLFGKEILTPRLTAWYGDEGIAYTYSGVTFRASAWTPALLAIKTRIEPVAGQLFNSVLLNLYRDGNDSMGWHSDDETELGSNPVIASVNLGQERRFDFRKKTDHSVKYQLMLGNGSLLMMKGDLQHHWQHQIAKSLRVKNARINLTFRRIN